ncbi:hypothetical protein IFR05_007681 [Cadophora sp. M221]|nr:hypothetical protein IFR05_007681 [Cadophora sp. M221]
MEFGPAAAAAASESEEEDESEGFAAFEGGKYKKAKGGEEMEIETIEEVSDEGDFDGVRLVVAAEEEDADDDEEEEDEEYEDVEDVGEDVGMDTPLLDELLQSDLI